MSVLHQGARWGRTAREGAIATALSLSFLASLAAMLLVALASGRDIGAPSLLPSIREGVVGVLSPDGVIGRAFTPIQATLEGGPIPTAPIVAEGIAGPPTVSSLPAAAGPASAEGPSLPATGTPEAPAGADEGVAKGSGNPGRGNGKAGVKGQGTGGKHGADLPAQATSGPGPKVGGPASHRAHPAKPASHPGRGVGKGGSHPGKGKVPKSGKKA